MWLLLTVVIKMMVIEPFFNNDRALYNLNDDNPLRQNDDECHNQMVILVKVINDAAPCSRLEAK